MRQLEAAEPAVPGSPGLVGRCESGSPWDFRRPMRLNIHEEGHAIFQGSLRTSQALSETPLAWGMFSREKSRLHKAAVLKEMN